MLGNAGGAKGPDFWCAFENGEVVVIGDEPANTSNDRSRRRLLCRGAKESYSPCRSRVRLVCLRVPCGEASRKAGCRKSARPVWVKSVGLAGPRRLPVYPGERTFSG